MSYQNYNQASRGMVDGQNRWNGTYSNPGAGQVYAQMQWESFGEEASAEEDFESVTTVDGIDETDQQEDSNSWQNQGQADVWNQPGNQGQGQIPQSGIIFEDSVIPDMSNIAGNQWQSLPSAMPQNNALPSAFNEELQRDLEYFESMYPIRVKQIKVYVNAACDGLEYKGSPMYDEYPDRVVMDQMVDWILERMAADGIGEEPAAAEAAGAEEACQATVFPPFGWGGRPPYPDNRNNWMRDVAAVLLFNEFFRRRCRSCGYRRFY